MSDEEPGIELYTDEWPVVVMRPMRSVTDEELQAFIDDFNLLLIQRGLPYSLVLDLRKQIKMSASQRQVITTDIQQGESRELVQGVAMVFTSSVMQMMLTAILWIARPPCPTKVFTGLMEARAWAREQVMGMHTEDEAAG